MKSSGITTIVTLLLLSLGTKAQVAQRVSIVIPEIAEIRLKPGSESNIELEFKDSDDLEKGITLNKANTYQVKCNSKWIVSMKASKPFFSSSLEEEGISLDVLSVKESKSPTFMTLNQKGIDLNSGNPGNFGGTNEFSIDYQASLNRDYPPGMYSMDVLLTVTSL